MKTKYSAIMQARIHECFIHGVMRILSSVSCGPAAVETRTTL